MTRLLTHRTARARSLVPALAAVLLAGTLAGCRTPGGVGAPWEDLFDGTTLTGWRAAENPASWSVRDGAIVAHGDRAHLFYVGAGEPPAYTDFELRLEVMTLPNSNGGVFIHTAYQESGWPAQGYEVQVNNSFDADPRRTGSLYGVDDITVPPAVDNAWFPMHIRVSGKRVTIAAAGQPLVDYTEPDGVEGTRRLSAGTIALQAHDPGGTVFYRNIRIRRLAPGETAAEDAPADPASLVAALRTVDYGASRRPVAACEDAIAAASARGRKSWEAALVDLLADPAATTAARDTACRFLLRIGSDASVPTLAALLNDPDLSHPARAALERIGTRAARAALRQAAPTAMGDRRLGIVRSLGALRDREAVALLKGLTADPDAADAAFAALGEIGGTEAFEFLRAARGRVPAARKAAATDALLLATESLTGESGRQAAETLYGELYRADEPAHLRMAALEGLVRVQRNGGASAAGERQAVGTAAGALRDADAQVRALGARLLAEIPGDESAKALADAVSRADAGTRTALLQAFLHRAEPAVRQCALDAVGDPDGAVRAAALDILDLAATAEDVPVLLDLALTADADGSEALCGVVSRIPGDAAESALRAAFGAGDAATRKLVMIVCRLRAAPATGDLVLLGGRDADGGVRVEAVRAFAGVLGAESVPGILAILADAPRDSERESIRAALVTVCRKSEDPDAAVASVCAAAETAASPGTRAELLRALGVLGGERSLALVQTALADPDAAVSEAAIRALGDWPDAAALPLLLRTAAEGDPGVRRVLALRGALRLLAEGKIPAPERIALYRQASAAAFRPEERRLVLSGLAEVAHPEAVALAQPYLEDPATRSEAATAMMQLGRRLLGIDREAAAEAVRKAASACPEDAAVQSAAKEFESLYEAMADTVMCWEMAGPFEGVPREQQLEHAFGPETGAETDWRPLPVGTDPTKPWLLDLKSALSDRQNLTGYLRTFVYVAEKRPARLDVGSDDAVKVWLNGRRVHTNEAARGVVPGNDKIPVTLYPGWNPLLVKVVQGGGDWGACVALVGRDGSRLPNLRAKTMLTEAERKRIAVPDEIEPVLDWVPGTAASGALPDATGTHGAARVIGDPAVAAGGTCMRFDGVDDEVRGEGFTALPTGATDAWTMHLAVRLEAKPIDLTILAGFGDSVAKEPNGCQRFICSFPGGIHFWAANVDVSAGVPFALGRTQTVTVTFDGRVVTLYVDGEARTSAPVELSPAVPVAILAPVDHWKQDKRLAGEIERFTILRGALSADAVRGLASGTVSAAPGTGNR